VSSSKPFVCLGGTTSWWDITISGRIDGRRLHRSVSTCQRLAKAMQAKAFHPGRYDARRGSAEHLATVVA
jgi:hypothetical protein